jgi:hypothetical protein
MTITTMTGPPRLILPRFGTPRDPSRVTYGHEVAEVARRLGKPLLPWQRYVADVALEVDPASGRLAYDEVDLTVPRQSGKTRLVFSKMTWRCTTLARRLGPQTVTYTAQSRNAARKKLERDFTDALREASGFRQIVNPKARPQRPTDWKVSLNNGAEHLLFGRGNYLQIDAPTKTAGHGDTLDDGDIDEAFAQRDDAIEQAMRPAQATRDDAQLWVLSTAGDELSYYLWRKVLAGRAALESGGPSRVAYFEWSIPPEADIEDEAVWWEFMPALGHTIRPEFIRAELERMRRNPDEGGEDLWRRSYGNQWVRIPLLNEADRPEVISGEAWMSLGIGAIAGSLVLGVDVAPDGESAAIVAVGDVGDGRMHVEVVTVAAGTFWLESRLSEYVRAHKPAVVAYDAGGPAASLAPELERAAKGVPVVKLGGRDYSAACEGFLVAVTRKRLTHPRQAWMSTALAGAAKKLRGDGWLWDRKSALSDITPLVAATVALRVMDTTPRDVPSRLFVAVT